MLCPEVSNFPAPKVITSSKKFDNLDKVTETFNMNNFYSSMIIALPDEMHTPEMIDKCITEDTEYYKITNVGLEEFIEPIFIEKYVKNGKLHCLSAERNCMVQNCAAITADGVLTIHVLAFIFQTLGLEGTKRPHNFYEIKIDLKNITNHVKLKQILQKAEKFDFWLYWLPNQDNICPSSIAKYFYEKSYHVGVHTLKLKSITPYVTEIPSINDVELDEMTEWIGMLALEGDLSPSEPYISSYCQPESDLALKTGRISVLIVKGFVTPNLVIDVCKKLHGIVESRETLNYWVSISVQSDGNSLWQWNPSRSRMFQAQDSTCNVFFTQDCINMFSVGQLKYS